MSRDGHEKRSIVVVDDDADFCASLADVLAGAGYTVTSAATARDALARARDAVARVFLVDVRLGKDNGTDLVQTLLKAEPRSLCVIMTAYAGTETAIRALKAGAYDYLVKPIEPEDLFATLDRCFERVRLQAENEAARQALEAGNRDLSRLNERLRGLVESAKRLAGQRDEDALRHDLLVEFARIMGADGGSLYVLEGEELRRADSLDPDHAPQRLPLPLKSGCVFEKAFRLRQPVLIEDIGEYPGCAPSGWNGYRNGSMLVMPMADASLDFFGLVSLHNKKVPPFNAQDLDLGSILVSLGIQVIGSIRSGAAHRASEALYREVFENASDGIFMVDVTPDMLFRAVSLNPAEEKMTGIAAAAAMGRTTEEFLLPETAAQVNANYRRCIEAGAPISYDELLDLPGGGAYFHTTLVPLRDETGRVHRILGVEHDITERRRTEELLRESEQRYREVFENTSDGLFMVEVTPDLRYRLMEFNPAQEQMLGVSRSVAVGRFNYEYLPKDVVETVNEQNRQCIEAGKPMSFESALVLPAGRSYFHTTLVPIRDAHGRIHRLVGLARDMTENRRMVEALRQSEEKFSKAFHGTPDSITISRLDDGVLLEVNRSFIDVYGYTREEVVGRSSFPNDLGIWVNPEDRARLLEMLTQRGEAVGEWVPFRRKNGNIRYGLVSWRIIEIDGEKRLLSITRDMTERKVMEEALRDSEARFRLLAENSTDMISRHTPEGDYLYVSPACAVLLGFAPEELVGTSPYELFHPDDVTAVKRSHATARQSTTSYSVSYRIRRKDGTYTWFETVSHGIRGPDSLTIVEIQCASRDISERVRAREREREHELQLFQAAKLVSLGTLVSGIAHEINNPNNFIRLNSQNLKEFWGDIRLILDEAGSKGGGLQLHGIPYDAARGMVDDLLGGIGEGSKRIEKLLLNLRDFARGDEGGLDEMVELNRVVRSGVMIVQNLIQKSTDLFSVRESPGLPLVRGNYHQLEQVVINLVTNACQALSSREKAVVIATTAEGDRRWVTLSVADEGIGIPQANLPRVADPFFTTKRQQGGSGLGLSVSSRIIQNHGGTMSFNSEVDKGTVVTVRLPAAGSAP